MTQNCLLICVGYSLLHIWPHSSTTRLAHNRLNKAKNLELQLIHRFCSRNLAQIQSYQLPQQLHIKDYTMGVVKLCLSSNIVVVFFCLVFCFVLVLVFLFSLWGWLWEVGAYNISTKEWVNLIFYLNSKTNHVQQQALKSIRSMWMTCPSWVCCVIHSRGVFGWCPVKKGFLMPWLGCFVKLRVASQASYLGPHGCWSLHS